MTMDEIKMANRKAGRYFFSQDTRLFFNCQTSDEVFTCEEGTFFVTSEKCPGLISLRKYTVRFTVDGSRIESLGEFQEYDSLEDALSAANKASEQGKITLGEDSRNE